MSAILSRGNRSTEVRLANLLRTSGITGWRRQYRLVGTPDFVFLSRRLAIFVDGCFWHGCPQHGTALASNKKFWREKIARNRARDRQVNRALKAKGWHVLRVWEHELAKERRPHLQEKLHLAMR
jgi:DNA mismatch endonuclease (patch repair protein)